MVIGDVDMEWTAVNEEIRNKLVNFEKRCEAHSWEERRCALRIQCALLRGIRPDVPTIKAVTHKYHSPPGVFMFPLCRTPVP